MAKGQTLAWRELRVGILVVASFVLLAVAIFYIGGDSGFFTPKYRITAYFHSANGLHAGAAVLLDGFTIGNVSTIKLSSEAVPEKWVEVEMDLNKSYRHMIRTDTMASIGTVGVLGDQQVELTRGSADKEEIPEGGSIQGADTGDIKKIITGTNDVVANLGVMTNQVTDLLQKVNQGKGTLGKILNDTSIYDNFDATAAEATALVKDARTGSGTIGQLMSNDELYRSVKASVDRLDSTMNKVDIIVDKINNGNGTVPKLLNDPAVFDRTNQLLTKFGTIADRIERGEGTLGKLSKEDALYNNMNGTLVKANTLLTSVENGEGTLGKMMKDPTLYNSLTQTSSELQKLMYDFRQNPKKYLTINFRLF
jgi:phospholipid/cholesterol/gamma-HCH transport system substrate-binding protein